MPTTTIANILKIAGAALAAFLVALVGTYVFLPESTPDTVASSDSSATAGPDTTAERTAGPPARPDSTAAPGDTPRRQMARLRDSVQTLRQQLQEAQEEVSALQEDTSTLHTEAETLRDRLTDSEDRRVKTAALKDALLDLGQGELATLLAEVNMPVVERLYQETTGRARTKLLRAMAPKRAARFVNQVVGEGGDADTADTARRTPPSSQASRAPVLGPQADSPSN